MDVLIVLTIYEEKHGRCLGIEVYVLYKKHSPHSEQTYALLACLEKKYDDDRTVHIFVEKTYNQLKGEWFLDCSQEGVDSISCTDYIQCTPYFKGKVVYNIKPVQQPPYYV